MQLIELVLLTNSLVIGIGIVKLEFFQCESKARFSEEQNCRKRGKVNMSIKLVDVTNLLVSLMQEN